MQTNYLYEIASKKLESGENKESVINFINESIDSVNNYLVPTFVDGEKGVVWSTEECYEVVDYSELKAGVKRKIK